MQIYDTLGSDALIDFLKKMFKIHGRFAMILDNAPGHTSKTLNNFIESTHGKIMLIYLLSYTPQLNPIEPQWAVLKRLIAGRDLKSKDDLAYAVNTLIEAGQIKPVKLWDCLVPSKSRKAGILQSLQNPYLQYHAACDVYSVFTWMICPYCVSLKVVQNNQFV